MSIISYDGQSLSLGGRRVWLVGGQIDYARVPRELWAHRIQAARQAGLNCIWTSCVWQAHEPTQGNTDFADDLDLRAFVQLVGRNGLLCALRVGPYVGDGWDNGGLPGWLAANPAVRLREANPPYLEACGRYFKALLDQVKDLQVHQDAAPAAAEAATMSGPAAPLETPVVMVQSEHQWTCANPDAARAYLGELFRYLREHGCTVPVVESNHLWSHTDLTIAAWGGSEHLAADLRQLQQVQPHAPRFLAGYEVAQPAPFANPTPEPTTPDDLLHDLASVLATGAQYCVAPLHGGTNFAFNAGQTPHPTASPLTTSNDRGAPLTEAGTRRPSYLALKRISTFATRFGQLFANLQPDAHHAAVAVDGPADHLAVIHQRGAQGDVVFLFNPNPKPDADTEILLPNGLTLPVPLGNDRVAWFVTDAPLNGDSTLQYTNLRPWALVARKLLVLFGPPGADGIVCIDGSALHITVPTGNAPAVDDCEGITVAVLNNDQIDAAYPTHDGIFIGATGLDDDGQPLPLKAWTHCTVVATDGKTRRRKTTAPPRTPPAPKLTKWESAPLDTYTNGQQDRYESIDGPASLESLQTNDGYGWYRVECGKNPKAKAILPPGAGRLHLFRNSQPLAVANDPFTASHDPIDLQATGTLVVLAEITGRFYEAWQLGTPHGLTDHLYAVTKVGTTPLKTGRDRPPDLFALRAFFPGARPGVQGATRFYTWSVKPVGANPVYVQIDKLPARALLSVNDEPLGAYDPHHSAARECFVLRPGEHLRRGNNTVRLSMLDTDEPAPDLSRAQLTKHVNVYQGTKNLTARATWAFAPWEPPADDQYARTPARLPAGPRWFRAQFNVTNTHTPLWFEPNGLSKGQLYLNGRNLGRYAVATPTGRPIPGQTRYYLPEPWLNTDAPNTLTLFDEQGRSPKDTTLAYDPTSSTGQ